MEKSEKILLMQYRLITPPWLYFALVKEYKRIHGVSSLMAAKKIAKDLDV